MSNIKTWHERRKEPGSTIEFDAAMQEEITDLRNALQREEDMHEAWQNEALKDEAELRKAAQQAENWLKWFCNEECSKLPANNALEVRQTLTAALKGTT